MERFVTAPYSPCWVLYYVYTHFIYNIKCGYTQHGRIRGPVQSRVVLWVGVGVGVHIILNNLIIESTADYTLRTLREIWSQTKTNHWPYMCRILNIAHTADYTLRSWREIWFTKNKHHGDTQSSALDFVLHRLREIGVIQKGEHTRCVMSAPSHGGECT